MILQNIASKGVNIVVHLFNILLNGNEISCDYTPETSDKAGHVVMDTENYEMKDVTFSDYEYGKKMYVSQVCSKLEKLLVSKNSIPEEITAVWF